MVFEAHDRPPLPGKFADALIAPEDAGCFYHPESRAQAPCDVCGRFLCALCDIHLQGQHICPTCLNSGRKKRKIHSLENERVMYGGLASVLAIVPLILFWPVTLITGPLAVVIAIYGWRKPQSITGARRLSYVTAIVFGLGETAGWAVIITYLFKHF